MLLSVIKAEYKTIVINILWCWYQINQAINQINK